MALHATVEHPGELTATTNPCGSGERGGHQRAPIDQASSETVSRLRPLARRRLSTSRPFFVSMRTRKPWVFARRRVLGWNVRFPLAISVSQSETTKCRRCSGRLSTHHRLWCIAKTADFPRVFVSFAPGSRGVPVLQFSSRRLTGRRSIEPTARRRKVRVFHSVWKTLWKMTLIPRHAWNPAQCL